MSRIYVADKVTLDKAYKESEELVLNNLLPSKSISGKKADNVFIGDLVCKDQFFDEYALLESPNAKFLNDTVVEKNPTQDNLKSICKMDSGYVCANKIKDNSYRFDLIDYANKHKEKLEGDMKVSKLGDILSFNGSSLSPVPEDINMIYYEYESETNAGETLANIYILDRYMNRVMLLDKDLNFKCQFGITGETPQVNNKGMNNPTGMVYDKKYNALYVADYGNHRLLKLDGSNLEYEAQFGITGVEKTDSTGLKNPVDVTVSPDGTLYVIDGSNRMVRLSRDMQYISQFGGDGQTTNDRLHLNNPKHIEFLNVDNSILIDDAGNTRVICIDADTIKYKDQFFEYPEPSKIKCISTETTDSIYISKVMKNSGMHELHKYVKTYNSSKEAVYSKVEELKEQYIINDLSDEVILLRNIDIASCILDDSFKIVSVFIDMKMHELNIAVVDLEYFKEYRLEKRLSLENPSLDYFIMEKLSTNKLLFIGRKDNKGYYGIYSIDSNEKELKVTKFNDACYNEIAVSHFALDTLKGYIVITRDINNNVKVNILTVAGDSIRVGNSTDISYILSNIKIELLNSNMFLLSGYNDIMDDEVYLTLSLRENSDKTVTVNVNNTYYLKKLMTASGLIMDNIKINVLKNTISCTDFRYYIGVVYEKINKTITAPKEYLEGYVTELLNTEVHLAFLVIPDLNDYDLLYDKNLDLTLNYNLKTGIKGNKFETNVTLDDTFTRYDVVDSNKYNIYSTLSVTTTKAIVPENEDAIFTGLFRTMVLNKIVDLNLLATTLQKRINAILKDESIGDEQKQISIFNVKNEYSNFDNVFSSYCRNFNPIDRNSRYKICIDSFSSKLPNLYLFCNDLPITTDNILAPPDEQNKNIFGYSVLSIDRSMNASLPMMYINKNDMIGTVNYFNINDKSKIVSVTTSGISYSNDRNSSKEPPVERGLGPNRSVMYNAIAGFMYGNVYGNILPLLDKNIFEEIKPVFIQIDEENVRLL